MLTRQVDAFVGKDYQQAHDWPTTPTRTCSGSPGSWRTPSARPWRPGCRRAGHRPAPAARPRRPGSAMSGPASRRAALLVADDSTTCWPRSLAGAAAAARPGAQPVRSGRRWRARGRLVPSVRDYPHVAEPVRLRIPAPGWTRALQRLGRAADMTIEVPKDFAGRRLVRRGAAAGPARAGGDHRARRLARPGPRCSVALPRLALGRGGPGGPGRRQPRSAFQVSGWIGCRRAAFPTEQVYGPTLEPSLRLVTCGGGFDRATRKLSGQCHRLRRPPSVAVARGAPR